MRDYILIEDLAADDRPREKAVAQRHKLTEQCRANSHHIWQWHQRQVSAHHESGIACAQQRQVVGYRP